MHSLTQLCSTTNINTTTSSQSLLRSLRKWRSASGPTAPSGSWAPAPLAPATRACTTASSWWRSRWVLDLSNAELDSGKTNAALAAGVAASVPARFVRSQLQCRPHAKPFCPLLHLGSPLALPPFLRCCTAWRSGGEGRSLSEKWRCSRRCGTATSCRWVVVVGVAAGRFLLCWGEPAAAERHKRRSQNGASHSLTTFPMLLAKCSAGPCNTPSSPHPATAVHRRVFRGAHSRAVTALGTPCSPPLPAISACHPCSSSARA